MDMNQYWQSYKNTMENNQEIKKRGVQYEI